MAKDSYWFKHDSTAGRATRMRKMAFIHGHLGKGLYWDVIEYLRDQSDYMAEYDEISLNMLCEIVGFKDPIKFRNWFHDCLKLELFEINGDKFFSSVLSENMKKWESTKNAGIQSGKKRNERNSNETRTKLEHNIIEENSIKDNIIEENIYKQFLHLKISILEKDELIKLGYTINQINNVLDRIHNYKNNKNYTSLFLTAKSWLEKDKSKEVKKGIKFFQDDY